MSGRARILFVAMQDSVHAARWVSMVADAGHDLHFYPAVDAPTSSRLRDVVLYRPRLPRPRSLAGLLSRAAVALRYRAGLARRAAVAALREPLEAGRRLAAAALRRARRPESGPWALSPGLRALCPVAMSADVARWWSGGGASGAGGTQRVTPDARAAVLASLIHELQPDVVHSLEFQHAGYLVLEAKRVHRACYPGAAFPRWVATNWGSDIYHFRHVAAHEARIRELLAEVDFYSCECQRDVSLAHDLGYRGPSLPVLPNSGGFDLDHLATRDSGVAPSQRRVIMVKGYQHFAGRALDALRVLEGLAAELRRFEVVVFSATADVRRAAAALAAAGTLRIRVLERVTHDEMLSWYGRARVYVGLSISDGISTSALEALAMGAFPVQTDTSCCAEWFEDGVGGFLVPAGDLAVTASRVARALEDDALVDAAARVNRATVARRLDNRSLRPRYRAYYETVLAGGTGA